MSEPESENGFHDDLQLTELDLDLDLLDDDELEETDDVEWAPVPLKSAREWLKANPDAAFEMNFPTVYEEDRSVKLKDIATAQGLDYISRARAATQAAQELGFEDYDFAKEMKVIQQEQKMLPQPAQVGAGDGIVKSIVGAPPGGEPGRPGVVPSELTKPGFGAGVDDAKPKRDDLSAPVQHAFRKQQKEVRRLWRGMGQIARTQEQLMHLLGQALTLKPVQEDATAPAILPPITVTLPPDPDRNAVLTRILENEKRITALQTQMIETLRALTAPRTTVKDIEHGEDGSITRVVERSEAAS